MKLGNGAEPEGGRMIVDQTTLIDLEIFSDASGRGGVLSLMDDTETEVGRKALRSRLANPFADVSSIVETQRAIAFLSEGMNRRFLQRDRTEAVRRYLDSNIVLVPPRNVFWDAVTALWLTLANRDVCREIRAGVAETVTLLQDVSGVARAMLAQDPPPVVKALASEIIDISDGLEVAGPSLTIREPMRVDRIYRGPARARLGRLLEAVGELDALATMARTTKRLGWVMPEIVEAEAFLLDGEGLFHPFIEDPVANPIRLSGGEPMVFLTGPNMAGKTTYLRTAALVVLLAQTGMGIPAERARLTPVDVLFTSLNPADNLRAGLSFFLSEVHRVRDAATHLADGRRGFVLFDEVFKGTNVKDALEASATVILGFAKAKGSGFIFSSHLVELVEALEAGGRVRFNYFDGRLTDGRAEYSYRMQAGVSDQRFGLQLLNEARIPDLLAQIGG
jgi:DNA mismatch repair ATPase MutS